MGDEVGRGGGGGKKSNDDFLRPLIISCGLGSVGRSKGNLSMGENRLEKIDAGINRLCQQISAPLRG